MDAARIADKYVARDGGPPVRSGRPAAREGSSATAETILAIASFIAWHDKGAMWGGYTSAVPAGEFLPDRAPAEAPF